MGVNGRKDKAQDVVGQPKQARSLISCHNRQCKQLASCYDIRRGILTWELSLISCHAL